MTKPESHDAVAGPVEPTVRPRAWEYVDRKGWVQALFAAEPHDLFPCKPLYDQATLDAAVAAERARCAQLCDGEHMKLADLADNDRLCGDLAGIGMRVCGHIKRAILLGPNVPMSRTQQL